MWILQENCRNPNWENKNKKQLQIYLSAITPATVCWSVQTLLSVYQPLRSHCERSKAAQTPFRSFNITTSSTLKLSLVYRFSLTGMMSCSLHLDVFHFIAMMTLPHQSEKSKSFSQAYYPPPFPRVIATLHPIRMTLGTEVKGLFVRCSHSSLFSFELKRTLQFFSCTCSARHANCLHTVMSQSKWRQMLGNHMHSVCVTILSSAVLWHLQWKNNKRLCFFFK